MTMRNYFLILLTTWAITIMPGLRAQVPELDWPIETVSEGHGFTEGAAMSLCGRIFFTDMDNQKILHFDPDMDSTEVWQEESGRANGLFIVKNLMYACEAVGRSVVQYDLFKGPGTREVLASTFSGDSLGSPNDITRIGDHLYFSEFWIGEFHQDRGTAREIFENRVYAYSIADGVMDSLAFDFGTPNGVASSPDGKQLYVGDFSTNKLYRAEVSDGKVGPVELFFDLEEVDLQGPDGMAVAQDGRIFLALYGSERLLVINPDGTPAGTLPTGPLTSNCVFAADGETLYITADKKLKRVIVPKSMDSPAL
jgi:gluconolactonase